MELVEDGDDPEAASFFALRLPTYERLYGYQRAGVAWMAQLWRAGQGGILADEMGLGKTVQVCAFLSGLRMAGASHALLLLPATLLDQWHREARNWCPGWPVYVYHGTPNQRARALRRVSRPMGGVLLTSYTILGNVDTIFDVRVDDPPSPRRRGPGSKRRRFDSDDDAASGSEGPPVEPELPAGGLPALGGTRPWDVVVCDEAHRMKGISTLLCRSLRRLRSRARLLLTGTPVQNALQDLWALMDFAQPGLLGNHATFVKHFSEPIDRGSVRGANPFQVELKRHLSDQLRQLVAPHLLRRTKAEAGLTGVEDVASGGDAIACDTQESSNGHSRDAERDAAGGEPLSEPAAAAQRLPPKRETVVWLTPTAEQTSIYRTILDGSDVVREACAKSKLGVEAFRAIGLLKRLCDHPALLLPEDPPGTWEATLRGDAEAGAPLPAEEDAEEAAAGEDAAAAAAAQEPPAPGASSAAEGLAEAEDARAGQAVEALLRELPRGPEALLEQSAKLRCLKELVPALAARGHRTLVFSHSPKMLDLVQLCCIKPAGLRCLRIDGQTPIPARGAKVDKFQRQPDRFQCMLLTTHVGGVGLNLTGADRVILVDPAWNPASDAQAVDRAFRIGQEREVRVYRLIMSGLIEDKMFRLQVFKMGLTKTALEADSHRSYFTSREIHALFEWTEPARGETRRLLAEKHGEECDGEVAQLAEEDGSASWLPSSAGLSDFGLLYGALAPQGQEDGACSSQVLEARRRLGEADERLRGVMERRQAAEGQLHSITRDLEAAAASSEQAKQQRAAAEEALRRKRGELASARRAESAAQQRLEGAVRGRAGAQEQRARAEKAAVQAQEALNAGAHSVAEAAGTVREADAAFASALEEAAAQASIVDESGGAVDNGLVDSSPEHLAALRAALAAASAALTDLHAREAALGSAEDGLAEGGDEEPRRVAESALRSADSAAQRAAQELIATGTAFVESLQRTRLRPARVDQARAAQRLAKAAFRRLGAAWQAASRSREGWARALTLRRKAAQRAGAGEAARQDAEVAAERAETELVEATAEEAARRAERLAGEEGLEAAEATRGEAEACDGEARRRLGELKAALAGARQEAKVAIGAEREATGDRQALHVACQKVEQAHSQLERAKLSAVRTLKAEEYDAGQVQWAYEQRKAAASGQ